MSELSLPTDDAAAATAPPGRMETRRAINVINYCAVDTKLVEGLLAKSQIELCAEAPFNLVLVDDYLDHRLPEFNGLALDRKQTWLPVKISGPVPWLGPLFNSEDGPCWECLAYRLRMNGFGSASSPDKLEKGSINFELLSGQTALLLALVEASKCLSDKQARTLVGRLAAFDSENLRIDYHPVVKRPQCKACGDPDQRNPQIAFASRPKVAGENGYRTCSAEETLARLAVQVSPITGIIAALGPSAGEAQASSSPVRAYIAKHRGHPLRKDGDQASRLELAFGKGMTDVQAKVSCIAEGIERYCGAFDPAEPRVVARYSELAGAIHPYELLLFSERQYDNRDATNRDDDLFNWVPHRFQDSEPIEWTPVWSLRDQSVKYLPSAFCYYYYPEQGKERFCIANSNGCASGNTVEEATLQALFEVVERDAVGIWWYNRLRLPEVDYLSFGEQYFQRMHAYVGERGRCLKVIDLTNDFSIPTFAAVSWRNDGRSILFGMGSHLEAKIAISRAITELNQRLPFAERVDNRGLEIKGGAAEKRIANWLLHYNIETERYLEPRGDRIKTAADFESCQSNDLLFDINRILDVLRDLHLDTLILDMTKPDIALSTVRVTIPGLRHSWARLGAGRMYDVPVKLGWLDRAHSEAQLNPIAYFV